ncbi:MAG: tetratricopeptide repeat protein [Candidatus Omnitrophota bacterium]
MSGNKTVLIAGLLLLALGFALYGGSVSGKFVWDDEDLVKNNIFIKKWSYAPKIFTTDAEAGVGKKSALYHPVQILSYRLNYFLSGLNPAPYHVTNIILHILVSLALFWIISLLFQDKVLSLLTAALFLAHPVHTEAVAYISGRSDMLVALFMLLGLVFYVKYLERAKFVTYVCALACYVLALFSKELSLAFPIALLLYHYAFKKKVRAAAFTPMVCAAAVYIFLRTAVLKIPAPHTLAATSFLERLPGFFAAMTNYMRLLFLPLDLHMIYANRTFSWFYPGTLSGVLIVSCLLWHALKKREENKLTFFSISWFFIWLLPLSNLYPINAYMAEHWLYVPSMAFSLMLAKALMSLPGRNKNRRIGFHVSAGILTALLAFYSFLTIRHAGYWKEPAAVYERALRFSPDNAGIYNNLGNTHRGAGMMKKAMDSYETAIRVDPGSAAAYNGMGGLLSEIEKTKEALEFLKKAEALKPGDADIYNNLGIAYLQMGDEKEAEAYFKKALEANPFHALTYNSLGNLYNSKGDTEKAVEAYAKAVEISPDYAAAYYNLGRAYMGAGKTHEAVASFKRCLKLDPAFIMAYSDLGTVYHIMNDNTRSEETFKKIIEIDPGNPGALVNLANIYIAKGIVGGYGRAEELLQKAISMDPAYAAAYNSLGNIYVLEEKNEEAVDLYVKAIMIDPEYAEAHSNLAVVYYYEKEYGLAIEHYDKAIRLGAPENQRFLEMLNAHRR